MRRCKYINCNKPLPETLNGKPLPLTFKYCPGTDHKLKQWEYQEQLAKAESARQEQTS